MNMKNSFNKEISLDTKFVRSKFPAFKDKICKKNLFFENAGGSYVPINVINHLNNFLISSKVQPYANFASSKLAGKQMDKAIKLISSLINAKKNEIIIGGSTTQNIYVLANAFKKLLNKNDEIIITNQDHEANIGSWLRLKDLGFKVKIWKMNKKNGELEISELKKLLSKKTKLVCVTHCSNIIGSINDIKKITKLVHSYGAYIFADGVSYAPHGFPDIKKLDVDFYSFSLYKTFGPHLGLLFIKENILKKLPNQNHNFLSGQIPYTLNPGGPNHEELASCIGIAEYFDELYNHHFNNKNLPLNKKIELTNNIISKHEEKIGNILLEYLNNNKNIRLLGHKSIKNKNRAPTFSFIHKKFKSKTIADKLVRSGVGTRNDNFYAWRCLKYLGINTNDGVVRISMVHYNTVNEVKKLINILKKII